MIPTKGELARWGDCPGSRTVVELDVQDLVRLGATRAELAVLDIEPSAILVRLWWFFVGPTICVQAPKLAEVLSRLGLVPRILGGLLPRSSAGAFYEGAHLVGAQLEGFDFTRANLRGANLRSANLRGARFQAACLEGACLLDADITGACFVQAHLARADLRVEAERGASFGAADLEGARWGIGFAAPEGYELVGETLVRERYGKPVLASTHLARIEGCLSYCVDALASASRGVGQSLEAVSVARRELLSAEVKP